MVRAAAPADARSTFSSLSLPSSPDSSASKYSYGKVIFESLALVNPTGDLGTTP